MPNHKLCNEFFFGVNTASNFTLSLVQVNDELKKTRLNPCSTILFEELTGPQLAASQEIPHILWNLNR
jgi:hypothetical protein